MSALFASLLLLSACQPGTAQSPAAENPTAAPAAPATEAVAAPATEAVSEPAPASPVILRFDAAPLHITQDGSVVRGERAQYSLETQANEFMQVALTAVEQNAAMTILGPDGAALPGTEEGKDATTWSGVVPAAGEYIIEVGSTRGNATYSLIVGVDPSTYQPVPAEVCQTLKADAETALKVTFVESRAPFYDYANQAGGTACLLTATGTGSDFANPSAVIDALKAAFLGWEENPAYAAGGPTGMAIGLTRDQALMLVSANWTPAAEANCRAGSTDCGLRVETRTTVVHGDRGSRNEVGSVKWRTTSPARAKSHADGA